MGLVHNNVLLNIGRPVCYNAFVEIKSSRLKGSNV